MSGLHSFGTAIKDIAESSLNDISDEEYRERHKILVEWWNSKADFIVDDISKTDPKTGQYGSYTFSWTQMVWQEIDMWTRLYQPVSFNEFKAICQRREFTRAQAELIQEYLCMVWPRKEQEVCWVSRIYL